MPARVRGGLVWRIEGPRSDGRYTASSPPPWPIAARRCGMPAPVRAWPIALGRVELAFRHDGAADFKLVTSDGVVVARWYEPWLPVATARFDLRQRAEVFVARCFDDEPTFAAIVLAATGRVAAEVA